MSVIRVAWHDCPLWWVPLLLVAWEKRQMSWQASAGSVLSDIFPWKCSVLEHILYLVWWVNTQWCVRAVTSAALIFSNTLISKTLFSIIERLSTNGVCLVSSLFCSQDSFKLQYLYYLPMPGQKNYPRNQYLPKREGSQTCFWNKVGMRLISDRVYSAWLTAKVLLNQKMTFIFRELITFLNLSIHPFPPSSPFSYSLPFPLPCLVSLQTPSQMSCEYI